MRYRTITLFAAMGSILLHNCSKDELDYSYSLFEKITTPSNSSGAPTDKGKVCFQLDNSTVALWYFNEDTNALTVKDQAGTHDLQLVNNPKFVSGQYSQALQFSGNNCITPYKSDLIPRNAITVEALINVDKFNTDLHSMIVSNCKWVSGDTGACGYELRLSNSGQVEFIFGDQDKWHSTLSEKKLELGKWYHIAGQYDGHKISVYVNDQLWAETIYEGKITPSVCNTTVARRIDDRPLYFYGKIDEIRISSVARYSCSYDNFFKNDTSTIALWYFNDGASATTVKDFAGTHNLQFVNNPRWVSGVYGQALQFSDNNCVTQYNSDLIPRNAITVEALINVDKFNTDLHSMIVSNCKWVTGETGACGYELRLSNSGQVEFIFGDQDKWRYALSQNKLELGKWYHIAGQYDGHKITVYVNDKLWAETVYEGKITPSICNTTVARRIDDRPLYFYGKIDEIRISSVARYHTFCAQ